MPASSLRPIRRTFLQAIPALLLCSTAFAQTPWPTKPVTIVVPFAPGGGTDIGTRILAQRLSHDLGPAGADRQQGRCRRQRRHAPCCRSRLAPLFRQALRHDAGADVGAATGCEWHDDVLSQCLSKSRTATCRYAFSRVVGSGAGMMRAWLSPGGLGKSVLREIGGSKGRRGNSEGRYTSLELGHCRNTRARLLHAVAHLALVSWVALARPTNSGIRENAFGSARAGRAGVSANCVSRAGSEQAAMLQEQAGAWSWMRRGPVPIWAAGILEF